MENSNLFCAVSALRAFYAARLSRWREMAALARSVLRGIVEMTSKWKKYTFTYPKQTPLSRTFSPRSCNTRLFGVSDFTCRCKLVRLGEGKIFGVMSNGM